MHDSKNTKFGGQLRYGKSGQLRFWITDPIIFLGILIGLDTGNDFFNQFERSFRNCLETKTLRFADCIA